MKSLNSTRRRWYTAVGVLFTLGLAAPVTQAEVGGSVVEINGAVYELRGFASPPCDAWEWTQLGSNDAAIEDPNAQTTRVQVGLGLYLFQVTCHRDDEEPERSVVGIDTRPPSIVAPEDLAEIVVDPFPEGPLCLSCPFWLDDPELSLTDPWLLGWPRPDWELDQSGLEQLLAEASIDPQIPAVLPEGAALEHAGLEVKIEEFDGQSLVSESIALLGYDLQHDIALTVGALGYGADGSLGAAAVLLEAGDP